MYILYIMFILFLLQNMIICKNDITRQKRTRIDSKHVELVRYILISRAPTNRHDEPVSASLFRRDKNLHRFIHRRAAPTHVIDFD